MSEMPAGIPADVLAWMKGLVDQRGPVPMVDQIFRHGRDYHECALRCLELRNDGQTFLFQPSLVLMAFVVEIYLKGLLVVEGKPARGHDHSKLFGQLSADVQNGLMARYAERHQGQKLTDDLPAYAKLFVEVRYSYEFQGGHAHDISGVAHLASALYETWVVARPDLVKTGIVHDRITAGNQGIPIFVSN